MNIITFGYRYPRATPIDTDMVLDARCLKEDPAEKEQLGHLTGLDEQVQKYLQALPDVQHFINAGKWVVTSLSTQMKSPTLAVACHSGRHRSVYIAEQIAKGFVNAQVQHLDIDRPAGGPDLAPDVI
jgi:UPF0042 nucleotide-binding protein